MRWSVALRAACIGCPWTGAGGIGTRAGAPCRRPGPRRRLPAVPLQPRLHVGDLRGLVGDDLRAIACVAGPGRISARPRPWRPRPCGGRDHVACGSRRRGRRCRGRLSLIIVWSAALNARVEGRPFGSGFIDPSLADMEPWSCRPCVRAVPARLRSAGRRRGGSGRRSWKRSLRWSVQLNLPLTVAPSGAASCTAPSGGRRAPPGPSGQALPSAGSSGTRAGLPPATRMAVPLKPATGTGACVPSDT